MSDTQMLTIALATVPTFLAVLVGILMNNSRLSDLRADINTRFSDVNTRFSNEARVNDANFKALLGKIDDERRVNDANFKVLLNKIDDIDSRLTRLEERFAR